MDDPSTTILFKHYTVLKTSEKLILLGFMTLKTISIIKKSLKNPLQINSFTDRAQINKFYRNSM